MSLFTEIASTRRDRTLQYLVSDMMALNFFCSTNDRLLSMVLLKTLLSQIDQILLEVASIDIRTRVLYYK